MTVLDDLVAKFRKGSPNIAAAFDEVQRRLASLESAAAAQASWNTATSVKLAGLEARLERLEDPVVEPPPPPPPAASAFFGLVVRAKVPSDINIAKSIGVKTVRVEFDCAAPASELDAWVSACDAAGIRMMPQAGFRYRWVSTADAKNLRNWALRFPGKFDIIEFGNETSYSYQYNGAPTPPGGGAKTYAGWAGNYALRAKEAAEALVGTGVGLGIQNDDANGWPWYPGMKSTVPNILSYAKAQVIHCYGPTVGPQKLAAAKAAAAADGFGAVPFLITEWGLSTDDGRALNDNYGWPVNQTYAQAAAVLKAEMNNRYRKDTAVVQVFYYMSADGKAHGSTNEREDYFGLVQSTGADKGALTMEARAQASVV